MGYYEIIKEAVLALKDRTGSSSAAIKKVRARLVSVKSRARLCCANPARDAMVVDPLVTRLPGCIVHRVRAPGDQVRTALAARCAQDGRREGQARHGESLLKALPGGEEAAQEEEGTVRAYTRPCPPCLPSPSIITPAPARLDS